MDSEDGEDSGASAILMEVARSCLALGIRIGSGLGPWAGLEDEPREQQLREGDGGFNALELCQRALDTQADARAELVGWRVEWQDREGALFRGEVVAVRLDAVGGLIFTAMPHEEDGSIGPERFEGDSGAFCWEYLGEDEDEDEEDD
jgi:hypothetical protein